MREIKFRAWDETNRRMYIPELVDNKAIAPASWSRENGQLSICLHQILMQYTGLKDKNGKEIYEVDIVQIKHPHKNREWTGQIIYDKYRFIGKGFHFSHFDSPDDLFSEGTEYIEVIGNIYENPNLMEDKT